MEGALKVPAKDASRTSVERVHVLQVHVAQGHKAALRDMQRT
jgi:hypothetical protein